MSRRQTGQPGRAQQVIAALVERGESIAVAESLTGGLLCSALVDVPGASAVVRGGIVSYTNPVKVHLLGVDSVALEQDGAVTADVARQMARGVRGALSDGFADWGIATTGVAGPDPEPTAGTEPGVVFVAVSGPGGREWCKRYELPGGREAIRQASVDYALAVMAEAVASCAGGE